MTLPWALTAIQGHRCGPAEDKSGAPRLGLCFQGIDTLLKIQQYLFTLPWSLQRSRGSMFPLQKVGYG